MSKKLTYESIKENFEKEGYTLLSKEYKNAHIKLDYVCSVGHNHNIVWNSWQQGKRCPYCVGGIKKDFNEIKQQFQKENYTLLSKEYINSKTKLKYICSKGHKHYITWGDWKAGCRCLHCSGNNKKSLNEVKSEFEKENYKLLSMVYKDNKTKLNYSCSYGHEHSITWNDWTNGYRCPTCAIIKNTGSGHYNWNGGTSYEPYCSIWKDKEYKQDIKLRDGNRCLNPYCSSKKPNDLTIHHIDYNKKNCHPSNLITICRSCNSMANIDRDWHKTWYQAIIKNRYYSRSV